MKIDHIGYLCMDIKKSITEFEALGYVKVSEVFVDNEPDVEGKSRGVYICFLDNAGIKVELISPIDSNSDVFKTLQRQGESPYHICYMVENLQESLEELKSSGWMILKRPAKAMAFDYSMVVFLFKKGIGMIELVEKKG